MKEQVYRIAAKAEPLDGQEVRADSGPGELEALDPLTTSVLSGSRDGSVLPQLQPPNVVQFAKTLDGLLDLLDATTDALAATWD